MSIPRAVFARQTDPPTASNGGAASSTPTVAPAPAGGAPAGPTDVSTSTPLLLPLTSTTPSIARSPAGTTTRAASPGSTSLGSGDITNQSNSTTLPLPNTTTTSLQSTDTSNSISAAIPTSSSGSRNTVVIAVVTVLAVLCLLATVLAILTRRRRRRRIDHGINKEFRSSSPDDDLFPVHFKSDSATSPGALPRGEKLQMLHIRTHDLGSSDGLLSHSRSANRDSVGSTSSAELTPTQPTSLLSSTAAPADSGSAAVERQFQASLAARARKMGIQPHQLLMLLTTSLDSQTGTGMSDVASTSDASSDRAFSVVSSSDRAFSLASVPPPYDHFATAVRRSLDVKR